MTTDNIKSSTIKVTITIPTDLDKSIINLSSIKNKSKSSTIVNLIKTGLRVALSPTVNLGVALEELNKSYNQYVDKKQSYIINNKSN